MEEKKENQEYEIITKKKNNQYFRTSILISLGFLLMGIILVWKSEEILRTVSYVLGGFFLAITVISFVSYFRSKEEEQRYSSNITYGILAFLAGLLLIAKPQALSEIIPWILGLWMTVTSATKVQQAFQLKAYNLQSWVSAFVVALITLICGIVLVFNPFAGASFIAQAIGIFLILYAVLDITSDIIMKVSEKSIVKKED